MYVLVDIHIAFLTLFWFIFQANHTLHNAHTGSVYKRFHDYNTNRNLGGWYGWWLRFHDFVNFVVFLSGSGYALYYVWKVSITLCDYELQILHNNSFSFIYMF